MTDPHPLDRAAWSALHGRHAGFAIVQGRARRYDPACGVFAALEDASEASMADLAALVARHGDVALLGDALPGRIAGLAVVSQDLGVQMVAPEPVCEAEPAVDLVRLTPDDAPAMLALATRTEPGPFFARTPALGDFFGVKIDGRLVAMAGERMKPDGFTEVSGVCTHPEHRGRGMASALMRHVARRIGDRGETAFLHAYASNHGAIALYESLGFVRRREVLMTRLTRG